MGHKRTRPKAQRLGMAKDWLLTYDGKNPVNSYLLLNQKLMNVVFGFLHMNWHKELENTLIN